MWRRGGRRAGSIAGSQAGAESSGKRQLAEGGPPLLRGSVSKGAALANTGPNVLRYCHRGEE